MNSDDSTPPAPRPLLFVSYSRSDLDQARPVIGLLEGAGFEVWWDGRLEGGENYLQTTEAALEGAAAVVVLWSATSVDSHWVRDEAQRGRERGCLVPLTIDGTMAPLGFRQVQLLDISGWDGSPGSPEAERMLVAVRARLGAAAAALPPAPARPLAHPARASAPPAPRAGLSRRGMMIGGAGAVGAAGVAGAWQFGLFSSPANATTSMVVLPFVNQTGDPDKKYFSDGLARELRAILSRNPRLRVAAPTSSSVEGEDEFALGRKLGVAHVLSGSVQRDTARVRVGVELVAVKDGEIVWSNIYDGVLDDIFAVQSEIARSVALELVAEVASTREAAAAVAAQTEIGGTQSVPAYEAFLRGAALYDLGAGDETDRAALEQFDAAIAADPAYASAHAMRATMIASIANNAVSDGPESRTLFAEALAAAKRALALEKRLARGHLALGFVLNNGWLKPAQAVAHYQAAQDLAAGDADVLRAAASFHAYGSDPAKAAQMIKAVLELDPLNARAFRSAGFISLFAHDFAQVVARMEQGLALNPSLASAHFGIAIARLMQDDPQGALKAAKAEPGEAYALTAAAIAHHRLGDRAASDAALAKIQERYGDSRYQLVEVHAQRGETGRALTLLTEAFEALDPGVLWAPNDPLLIPLRGEGIFRDLLSRLQT